MRELIALTNNRDTKMYFSRQKFLAAFVTVLALALNAVATDWDFLDSRRIGAAEFIENNPAYNGKQVVIIILDTGVDMGTPGLTVNPDGGVKVIDVQDFSGEGDVYLEKAVRGQENDEHYIANSLGYKLFGYRELQHTAVDSIYLIGFLNESQFKNSIIPDINNNGRENDRFGIAVFESGSGWLAYIDLDGDGNLTDEKAIRNYKENHSFFQFRGRDPKYERNLANFGLNIFPDEYRVNFHFDGDGHGTHVAGIAAGYKINGQEGLNGIAPGAQIISLKIGDGRLAGGATTSGSMLEAYEYGIEFAKKHDGPVVFNMSFGIGSEIEGQSEMEIRLDEFLRENNELVFCVSAGNSGPGISSIGLPSSAREVIAVGALLPKQLASDLYGADLDEDKIFNFSSRGGEVDKPDVIAPGAASSTIPPFSTREIKGGTSMASPQGAGAVALIMSAAVRQDNPLPIVGELIKKALINGADPLPGYLPVDQGGGVINVPKAFELYKKYVANYDKETVIRYDINTTSPVYRSENGRTAYWRFGDYAPDATNKQRFYINPVFPQELNSDQRHNFYRAFNLETSESWIKIHKGSTYIKGSKAAQVDVYFDRDQIDTPGIYNGKVIAYRKNGAFFGNSPENKEFELMCTIIKPVQFSIVNNFRWSSDAYKIKPGDLQRIFFEIPLKASSATIKIDQSDSKFANILVYLFDPNGHKKVNTVRFKSDSRENTILRLDKNDLQTGTWELVLYSDFRNTKTSYADVGIQFCGLEAEPAEITSVKILNGYDPSGSLEITNQYSQPVDARVSGKIHGIRRERTIREYSDKYEYAFKVGDQYEKVEFEIELDPETFNLFTDFAINIKDYSDKVLKSDGLNTRRDKITFIPPTSGSYILELIPAFATHEPKEWTADLKETFHFFKKLRINGSRYNFYPKIEKAVSFEIDGTLPVAPEDYFLYGEIWIDSIDVDRYRMIIPVKLYSGL